MTSSAAFTASGDSLDLCRAWVFDLLFVRVGDLAAPPTAASSTFPGMLRVTRSIVAMLITSATMPPKSGGLDPLEAFTTADEEQCLVSLLMEGNMSSNGLLKFF
jgi:hypothetical protein